MRAMISGYVRIALRRLAKNKLGAGIEILGLAIGLASCLLIFLFVRQETSYDAFYTRAGDIYRLLSRDFGWMIFVATLVAAPAVYFVMEKWLRDFAYRISVTADVVAAGGAVVLAIALLTVAYHGLQAARLDPVNCLRYE